jgi:hypothetical protein
LTTAREIAALVHLHPHKSAPFNDCFKISP